MDTRDEQTPNRRAREEEETWLSGRDEVSRDGWVGEVVVVVEVEVVGSSCVSQARCSSSVVVW